MLTAPQTFGEIARVGPIRRQAFKVRDMLADPRRTGYVAVALPEEMPVNETLELGTRLEAAVGLGLDAIVVNGLYPERFTGKEAEELRAHADGSAAVRAALTEHERGRIQRSHLRRLKREAGAPVSTLPYLFRPEIGLDEYGAPGGEAGPGPRMSDGGPQRRLGSQRARAVAARGAGHDRDRRDRGGGRHRPRRARLVLRRWRGRRSRSSPPGRSAWPRSCAGGAGAGTSARTTWRSAAAR